MKHTQIVSFFREVLEDRFGRTWLDQPKPSHPVRSMWQQANHDPFALIDLCRLGRDIDFLREVGDPDQQLYLAKLLDRVRGDASGALNLLYELHVAMLFRPEQGAQGGLAPEPDYPGYDVLVAVSDPSRFVLANGIYTLDERKMWVSCKRINESDQYKTFSKRARMLVAGMRKIATENARHTFAGFVVSKNELPENVDPILDLWAELCQSGAPYGDPRSLTNEFATVMQAQHPNVQPSNIASLRSAHAIEIMSALPQQETTRIQKEIKRAATSFKNACAAGKIPSPSDKDAWVLALDMPRWLSPAAVAQLALKEFAQGNFHDLSGLLLTRSLHGLYRAVPPIATATQEIYALSNINASVPLSAFLGDTRLQPRVEGEPLDVPGLLTFELANAKINAPDGFVLDDYGPQEPRLPHFRPDIVLQELRVPQGHEAAPYLTILERMPAPRGQLPTSGDPRDLPLISLG
jgi:hypothetical protein